MARRSWALVCMLIITAGACEARREMPGAAQAWEVAATPRLSVGDREDRDTVVFASVGDARLHPAGALVVADNGAFTVQVYDSSGALRARGGRRGQGPGEFSGRMALIDGPGDSVAIWDGGQSRWTLFSVADGGMRHVGRDYAQPAWMHAGVLVQSALAVPPAWVPPLLTALSDSSPDVRFAHIDRTGLLFVSQDVARSRWLIYRDSAAAMGELVLPEGFTLTHITTDAVVGLMADSVGLQQVVVHDLQRPPHQAPDLTPATAPAPDEKARGELRTNLRNAVMAQEMHWMRAEAYTAHADSLTLAFPPEARFRILEATARGWSGVAWYPASGYTCGMIVGLTVPAGWAEGEVRCGWQIGAAGER